MQYLGLRNKRTWEMARRVLAKIATIQSMLLSACCVLTLYCTCSLESITLIPHSDLTRGVITLILHMWKLRLTEVK